MHKILFLLCVVIVSGQKFTNKRFTVKKDGEYWYAMEKVGNGRLDWVRNRVDRCPLSNRFIEDNITVYRLGMNPDRESIINDYCDGYPYRNIKPDMVRCNDTEYDRWRIHYYDQLRITMECVFNGTNVTGVYYLVPPRQPTPPSFSLYDYTMLSFNKLYTISEQLGLITNLLRQMYDQNQFFFGNMLDQSKQTNNLEVLGKNMFLSQIAGDILTQMRQSNNKADNFYNAFVNYTQSNGNQQGKLIF